MKYKLKLIVIMLIIFIASLSICAYTNQGKKTDNKDKYINNVIVPDYKAIDGAVFLDNAGGGFAAYRDWHLFNLNNKSQSQLIKNILDELKNAKQAKTNKSIPANSVSPPKLNLYLKSGEVFSVDDTRIGNNILDIYNGKKSAFINAPKTREFMTGGWKKYNLKDVKIKLNDQLYNLETEYPEEGNFIRIIEYANNTYFTIDTIENDQIDGQFGSDGKIKLFKIKDTPTKIAIAIIFKESNPKIYLQSINPMYSK